MKTIEYQFFEEFAKAKEGSIRQDCAKLAVKKMEFYLDVLDKMMEEMVSPVGMIDELVSERNSGIQDCRKLIKEWFIENKKLKL